MVAELVDVELSVGLGERGEESSSSADRRSRMGSRGLGTAEDEVDADIGAFVAE